MDSPNVLQLYIPPPKFFGCQVLSISLVGYIVILAEDASKVAATEKD
jgi:hypothetical protein